MPGETCVNLLVDGKVVRTATGAMITRCPCSHFNVRNLVGKDAVH